MATYKQIQQLIKDQHGYLAQPCWIADVMAEHGLTKRVAPNRIDPNKREKPCPVEKRKAVEDALRHFNMI